MKLSKKVWNSPSIRTELAQLSAAAGLDYEVLIRPVSTRWNTVTEVIERALAMRDVLGDLCDKVQFNRRDGARLRRFMLTEEDWKLLDQLHRLLGVRLSLFPMPSATLPQRSDMTHLAALPLRNQPNLQQHPCLGARGYTVY